MAELLKNIRVSGEKVILITNCNSSPDNEKNNPDSTIEQLANSDDFLEEIRQQAFAAGFQAAETKYTEENQCKMQELEMQSTVLKQLLDQIPVALKNYQETLRDQIADIVLLISKHFFSNQISSKEAIIFQIEQAINYLNHKENIEIFLHPQDLALVQQSKLKIDFSECRHLKFIPDETLILGGCRIRNDHGLIDASIEQQIDKLKRMLVQLRQSVSQ
ncbi:FliH/SctL family protein [Legionella quinlivanii]|uniref:FliH/SctL family protein n=1 Tax=Legionella quinlivanii TaxID=45073 RepID=UPI002243BDF0|nr:FliH/SctL family protein [Legionella quinlivanii]MCW8451427.1 flagellar assembly protein FliH [Legionella quinlivanii]